MGIIENKLKNVRTLQDIVSILSILFYNMDAISRNYYNIFLDDNAREVPVELYNEDGKIVERLIPNVANYKVKAQVCDGDPNGRISGSKGTLCLDIQNQDLYYKATDPNNDGLSTREWIRLYDYNLNLLEVEGDGSKLHDLSTGQLERGVLTPERGGTGVGVSEDGTNSLFTGLVKANSAGACSKAVSDVDYVDPSTMTGIISHFAGARGENDVNIPKGWLVCDGREVAKDTYSRLYNVIGDTYGTATSEDNFKLPDLINKYVKGSAEASEIPGEAVVGTHTHSTEGTKTGEAGIHAHGPGNYEISGGFSGSSQADDQTGNTREIENGKEYVKDNGSSGAYGAFKKVGARVKVHQYGEADNYYEFRASRTWTGECEYNGSHAHDLNVTIQPNNDEEKENDVAHMKMIPIIKA